MILEVKQLKTKNINPTNLKVNIFCTSKEKNIEQPKYKNIGVQWFKFKQVDEKVR